MLQRISKLFYRFIKIAFEKLPYRLLVFSINIISFEHLFVEPIWYSFWLTIGHLHKEEQVLAVDHVFHRIIEYIHHNCIRKLFFHKLLQFILL